MLQVLDFVALPNLEALPWGTNDMRILVVEDDTNLNRQIKDALTEGGYAVDVAFDGEEGHFLGDTEPYDAVVLDIGLPQMDGLSVLEEWRRAGKSMPVLLLTARDRWSDTQLFPFPLKRP